MIKTMTDLVAFLRPFHRHWLDNPGMTCSAIPDDLPDELRTIYEEFGALIEIDQYPGPFSTQDNLLPVSRLTRIDDKIEFAWENQGNWSVRCAAEKSNPSVYSNARDLWQEQQLGFVKVCDSLEHFLITFCLQEAAMSCSHVTFLRTARPFDKIFTIELQPLWLNGHYVDGTPDHDFYYLPLQEALVMNWHGYWYCSNTNNAHDFIVQGVEKQVIY